MRENLKICCVLKSGGEYGEQHVENLRLMCERWIPDVEFVCLTDIKSPLFECVSLTHKLPGWWSKMELFDKFRTGLWLFFDLDTIIRKSVSLDFLSGQQFCILRDFYRGRNNPLAMGSGVMFWNGDHSWIWEAFQKKGLSGLRGDQDFLEMVFRDANRGANYFQDITDQMASYKADNKGRDASIVVFHGKPRPWQQLDIPYPAI